MRLTLIFFFILVSISINSVQAQFTESNLPIFVINTNGETIFDEPKVNVTLGIINNSNGVNKITDPFNEFEGRVGIELRGQSSLDLFPKKGYGFEFRDELGEDLEVSILGLPEESDFVLHNPYSDKSLMRNALIYILAGEVMEWAPRVRFCELVIDGSYEGVYLLVEKIKRDNNRVKIAKLPKDAVGGKEIEGGYIVKFDKIDVSDEILWTSPFQPYPGAWQAANFIASYPKYDEILPQQVDYIANYITDFEKALKAEDFTYQNMRYSEYIDVQSFIDFTLLNEFAKNVDGYRLSTYMHKDTSGLLKMGPIWDFNLAFGNADYCLGGESSGWEWDFNAICPGDFWVNHFWWKRLLQDEAYTDALKDRWDELKTSALSVERAHEVIDSLADYLGPAVDRNFDKWPVLGQYVWPNRYVGQTYQQEIVYLKGWIEERFDFIEDRIVLQGITPANSLPFGIHPNPTDGEIAISFGSLVYTGLDLAMYNSTGQLILKKDLKDYNGEPFRFTGQPGVYFYHLISTTGEVISETYKLVVI